MSDTVGSNTKGLLDPENNIFELVISFLSCLQAEIDMCTSGLGGCHLEKRLLLMSDTVGCNTNGLPHSENNIFELRISFLSCLQAEISVFPVWVAAILFFGLTVARDTVCNSTFEEPD